MKLHFRSEISANAIDRLLPLRRKLRGHHKPESPMTHKHQRPGEDIAVVGVDIGKDVFHGTGPLRPL